VPSKLREGHGLATITIPAQKPAIPRQLPCPCSGIKEVAENIWLVSFMHYDLGFFDHETGRVECAPNPFGAKVLPMSPE
jgi:hypothetical protein